MPWHMMLSMTQLPEQGTAPGPELLTAKEAGEALGGISDETINRWARQGKLSCITLPGGQRRYRREVIDAILAGTTTGSAA
jgi:excisionase family DNA binding protein